MVLTRSSARKTTTRHARSDATDPLVNLTLTTEFDALDAAEAAGRGSTRRSSSAAANNKRDSLSAPASKVRASAATPLSPMDVNSPVSKKATRRDSGVQKQTSRPKPGAETSSPAAKTRQPEQTAATSVVSPPPQPPAARKDRGKSPVRAVEPRVEDSTSASPKQAEASVNPAANSKQPEKVGQQKAKMFAPLWALQLVVTVMVTLTAYVDVWLMWHARQQRKAVVFFSILFMILGIFVSTTVPPGTTPQGVTHGLVEEAFVRLLKDDSVRGRVVEMLKLDLAKLQQPQSSPTEDPEVARQRRAELEALGRRIDDVVQRMEAQEVYVPPPPTSTGQNVADASNFVTVEELAALRKVWDKNAASVASRFTSGEGSVERAQTEIAKLSETVASLQNNMPEDSKPELQKVHQQLAELVKDLKVLQTSTKANADKSDHQTEQQSAALNQLTSDLLSLGTQVNSLADRVTSADERVAAASDRVTAVADRVTAVSDRVDSLAERNAATQTETDPQKQVDVDYERVRQMIVDALLDHDADKIVKLDWALASLGASIVSASPSFQKGDWLAGQGPGAVLLPSNFPGECYCMSGDHGGLVIHLGDAVRTTEFTMEHLDTRVSGDFWKHAPKHFRVWGLPTCDPDVARSKNRVPLWEGGQVDETGKLTAEGKPYVYEAKGTPIQTVPSHQQTDTMFKCVGLEILDNYGAEDFTTLYRFRVHGNTPTYAGSKA